MSVLIKIANHDLRKNNNSALLEKSREITPERKKRPSQSENNTQLWIRLVMEVKSDAVKNNIAQEPGRLGP